MLKFYIDEAGYTGNLLASEDQEFFVLTGVLLSKKEVIELYSNILIQLNKLNISYGTEIKGNNIAKTKGGMELILQIVSNIPQKTILAEKKYALIAKYLDWIFEEHINYHIYYSSGLCSGLIPND